MKKILSFLSAISLSTIITTNIIACNTPNTNNKPNKLIEPKFIPQQPPTNSNWKLFDNSLTNIKNEFKNYNNKWYLIIQDFSRRDPKLFKYNDSSFRMTGAWLSDIKKIYRWDGVDKPQMPVINRNTYEITNLNEKIEFIKILFFHF